MARDKPSGCPCTGVANWSPNWKRLEMSTGVLVIHRGYIVERPKVNAFVQGGEV